MPRSSKSRSPRRQRRFGGRALYALGFGLGISACNLAPEPAPYQPPPPPVEQKKDYERPLPAGEFALRRLEQDQWPDLAAGLAYRRQLRESIEHSLHYLGKPSSRDFFPQAGIPHERVVQSLQAFLTILDSEPSDEAMLEAIRRRFDCYVSVGCDSQGTVLFTGYYTPIFEASLRPSDTYRFPLHGLPDGHVKDPKTGETLGLRRADGSLQTDYPDRDALLGSGILAGKEIAYLKSPFEAYVIGVQGSAVLELTDGSHLGVGYAGSNGLPYTSLGRELVAQGKLQKHELNLHRLIQYFDEHPAEFGPLAAKNERYVFFQEASGEARGCLNEPVTALRSIATDKSIFPRASLCFVEAPLPVPVKSEDGVYRGFFLDQDAGGAIRAPGRCDVYMGVGDEAGALAGRTLAEGKLYYLFLKEEQLASAW